MKLNISTRAPSKLRFTRMYVTKHLMRISQGIPTWLIHYKVDCCCWVRCALCAQVYINVHLNCTKIRTKCAFDEVEAAAAMAEVAATIAANESCWCVYGIFVVRIVSNDIFNIFIIIIWHKSLLHKEYMSVKNCVHVNENENLCKEIDRKWERVRLRVREEKEIHCKWKNHWNRHENCNDFLSET